MQQKTKLAAKIQNSFTSHQFRTASVRETRGTGNRDRNPGAHHADQPAAGQQTESFLRFSVPAARLAFRRTVYYFGRQADTIRLLSNSF